MNTHRYSSSDCFSYISTQRFNATSFKGAGQVVLASLPVFIYKQITISTSPEGGLSSYRRARQMDKTMYLYGASSFSRQSYLPWSLLKDESRDGLADE